MDRFCCCFSGGGTGEKNNKVSSEASGGSARPFAADKSTTASANAKSPAKAQSPLLVELFTSQGCSSCPPADLLISKLGQSHLLSGGHALADVGVSNDAAATDMNNLSSTPIIALAYHVDYWDYLGWKDPFANNRWSTRQRSYGEALQQDSIYTPEIVIQGRAHCIGSNVESVSSLIDAAPRFPAPDFKVSFSRPTPTELQVSLSVSFKLKVEGSIDVMVALFENGQVTDCSKGENRGKMLTNDFIVRALEKACTFQGTQSKKSHGQANLQLWEGYSKVKCGMAIFLQNPSSMEVYGAQVVELPEDV